MRVLGIDYGSKRIGLALSDPGGRIALPAGTLERRGAQKDIQELARRVAEEGVERIVIGLPLHMNGRQGPEAEAVRSFAEKLGNACKKPVDFFDERMTTLEAERAFDAVGTTRKKRKENVDSAAATILLRAYLEGLE